MAMKRMLLGMTPRLLQDLVMECLRQRTELQVVGELEDESSLLALLDQHEPDVILLTLPEPVARIRLESLFTAHPDVTWWLLSDGGRQVERVERAALQKLGQLSPQELVDAIASISGGAH